MTSVQRCASCGAEYAAADPLVTCSACDGLLEVEHRWPTIPPSELRRLFASRPALTAVGGVARASECSGVWRYRELVMPDAGEDAVSYPEGNTPLVGHHTVSSWTGVADITLKHEGMNPTGSFKDRGMAVALTQARRVGARAVLCASTGNTSSSMAAYAALAGVRAVVLVPARNVSAAKVAQTAAYGATLIHVRGDFDDCLRLARQAAGQLGVYLVNSVNPWRLEGQKTIVFELLQQLGWDPPDWLALPAGNLGNAAAFGAALGQARALGLIFRLPRLLLVQAEGAAPFAKSYAGGFATRYRVSPSTVASAIRIGDPASYHRAVRAVRESDGVVTQVSDQEILEAKGVVDRAGLGCEPASAASVAGVRRLRREGAIQPGARVTAVLTGHLLKDVAPSAGSQEAAGPALEIDADFTALETVLRDHAQG